MDYQEAMRKAQAFRKKSVEEQNRILERLMEEEEKERQQQYDKAMSSDVVKNSLSIYNPVMQHAPEEINVRPEHMPKNVTPHIQNTAKKGLKILGKKLDDVDNYLHENNLYSEPVTQQQYDKAWENPMTARIPQAKTVSLNPEDYGKITYEDTDFSTPEKRNEFFQANVATNPVITGEYVNMTPEEQSELPAFQKGVTQSIGYKIMGLQGIDLPEDAPLSDKIKFALGKGVADLPVFAGLAMGGAAIGLPAFLGAGLLFGGYEALDAGVDAYSRQKYGTELPGMVGVNPVEYGLEHFGPGALKGMAGHGLGKVAMGGVGLLQRLAVKKGANAFTAHKVATVMKPLAYEVAQNEVIGQASAIQHGYDYDMEQRLVDGVTTSIMNVTSKASRKGVEILKAKPRIEGETAAGSTLDDVVETYKNKVVDDVAIETARKHFVQGGTPEETARLTMVKMEEMTGREGMGHPFKNPEDRFNFIKRVSEQAKQIHENYYDELSLNRRDVLVDDVLPIGDLGKGNNYSTYKKLLN